MPGGADTGYGLLVLVNLLKCYAQGCAKFWLAYSQFDAPLSDALGDVNIDWFRPNLPLATGSFCPHRNVLLRVSPTSSVLGLPLRFLRLQPP